MFVSMDVTFRESEPFYGEKTDLNMLFEGLDHPSPTTDGQEGESKVTPAAVAPHATNGQPPSLTIGSPLTISAPKIGDARTISQPQGQEPPLQVYSRRRRRENAEQGENDEHGEDNYQIQQEPQMQEEEQSSQGSPSSAPMDENSSVTEGSADLPIALRKGIRAATSRPV